MNPESKTSPKLELYYNAYCHGWRDSSSYAFMDDKYMSDPDFKIREEYEKGYDDAIKARKQALKIAKQRLCQDDQPSNQ